MNHQVMDTNQNIALSMPIKISFNAINDYLKNHFVGTNISNENSSGKEVSYFKILDMDIRQNHSEAYNMELDVKLETLTTIYSHREMEIAVQLLVHMDVEQQKISIQSYKVDSKGKNWLANKILESVINTFVYGKIIEKANFELQPIILKNLTTINEKLASEMEVQKGISLLGALEDLKIIHFMIKESDIWVVVSVNGWGVIEIKELDF